ncbi:D-Ala-D-Ala ligase-like protein [Novosphingobium sp. PhB55]|uniref:ATP-binding protein n=1 Tax=Novosphingobium sp. PhB55 TaxID=2485106 RepID=UPI001065F3E8|nr:biotin carboxylase [Novosphingobium sp. PhB55]TDW67335.1 D-Ala-D-Ala ligase-like protein [Novosphingobium sp. PhB55]
MTPVPDPREQTIAILYQALEPPVIDGARKEAKPGGYSDSGADIGVALLAAGCTLATPVADPDPTRVFDWVWPDTEEGIAAALNAGATLLWANTVVFAGHPIEAASHKAWVVGPDPRAMQEIDDKAATNTRLLDAGLPVARSWLIDGDGDLDAQLAPFAQVVPIVVKPLRGRGSQGVGVARTREELAQQVRELAESRRFGAAIMLEQFLPGQEITITVMPAACRAGEAGPFALPPVRRFDQIGDVAPYNGDVPVSRNSAAMTPEECADPAIAAVTAACEKAAALLEIRATMRIDCRADAQGAYFLFDVNAKPNLTGAGRPGREDEDSLSTIAAAACGWTYPDFLLAAARGAWRSPQDQQG